MLSYIALLPVGHTLVRRSPMSKPYTSILAQAAAALVPIPPACPPPTDPWQSMQQATNRAARDGFAVRAALPSMTLQPVALPAPSAQFRPTPMPPAMARPAGSHAAQAFTSAMASVWKKNDLAEFRFQVMRATARAVVAKLASASTPPAYALSASRRVPPAVVQ